MATILQRYPKLYKATSKITTVSVPSFNCIAIDGYGSMFDEQFKLKYEAIKLASSLIKKHAKGLGRFICAPVQGTWDTYDNENYSPSRKKQYHYTLLCVQPNEISHELFEEIKESFDQYDYPYLKDIHFTKTNAHKAIQTLHKGSIYDEFETTKRMMEYVTVNELKLAGFHHEIYLTDFFETPEEKSRMIIRFAVEE